MNSTVPNDIDRLITPNRGATQEQNLYSEGVVETATGAQVSVSHSTNTDSTPINSGLHFSELATPSFIRNTQNIHRNTNGENIHIRSSAINQVEN